MEDEIAEIVRECGWFGANINDADPPFCYTIGLMETLRHPEFIIFGFESASSNALFSQLFENIRSGCSYSQAGVYPIVLGNDEHRIGIRQVDPTQHELYLGFAMGFLTNAGRIGELEAIQVFWPDRSGKFPFDAGCDLGVYDLQPRLDIALTPRELRKFRRQFEE